MRANINAKRFCAILLVLVYLPLFSFFTNIDGESATQAARTSSLTQDVVSNRAVNRGAATNQNLLIDIFVPSQESFQNAQQLSSRKSNGNPVPFWGLLYVFLFLAFACVTALSNPCVFKFNRHLVIPHSIHAPPKISCYSN